MCTLWSILEPERLSDAARSALVDRNAKVHLSAMSSADIACLTERGRVRLDRHWKPWFNSFVSLNGWRVLDVTLEVIQEGWSLPGEFHQDPADRILVATARTHRLTVVTGDRRILGYPHVDCLW